MAFQPGAGEQLTIGGQSYRVAEHPVAAGTAYGQEGRQATVYQLLRGAGQRALKVFKPAFRAPGLVLVSERIGQLAALPGLAVCARSVVIPQRDGELLARQPDLTYAMVMPWIAGPTWMDVLLEHRELSADESVHVARSLAAVLTEMEQRGVAHGDLSAPNVLLPGLADGAASGSAVEL